MYTFSDFNKIAEPYSHIPKSTAAVHNIKWDACKGYVETPEKFLNQFEDVVDRFEKIKIDFNWWETLNKDIIKKYGVKNEGKKTSYRVDYNEIFNNFELTEKEKYASIFSLFLSCFVTDNFFLYFNNATTEHSYTSLRKIPYSYKEILTSYKVFFKEHADDTEDELLNSKYFSFDLVKNYKNITNNKFILDEEIADKPTLDKQAKLYFDYINENIDLFDEEYISQALYMYPTIPDTINFISSNFGNSYYDRKLEQFLQKSLYSISIIAKNFIEETLNVIKIDYVNQFIEFLKYTKILKLRYRDIIKEYLLIAPAVIANQFNTNKQFLMLYDEKRTMKLEKRINNIPIILYKFYKQNAKKYKVLPSIINRFIRYQTTRNYWIEGLFYLHYDHCYTYNCRKNCYMLTMLTLQKIIMKAVTKGKDPITDYDITSNNLTSLIVKI